MPEPITTIGLGAIAAYLGKDGLEKLLGPTAEYLGEGIKELTRRRVESIGRILQNASSKLGNRLESLGTVPPRVLKTILDEGSYCEDEVAVEYFGGVLASSRTKVGRDDRGARMAKLIDGLSTYQMRTHYFVYGTVRTLFAHRGLSLRIEHRPKMKILLPFEAFRHAMEFNEEECAKSVQLINHIFFGLAADSLIEPAEFHYGDQDVLAKRFPGAAGRGIVCQPSALGVEVFLWAFGHGDEPNEFLFEDTFEPRIGSLPPCIEDASSINNEDAT